MCDAARHLPERPQALLTVLQLENKAGQIKDVAYDLRDTTVVDLTDWQSHWSFASTPGFMVQSIRGTAILPQAGDYIARRSEDARAAAPADAEANRNCLRDVIFAHYFR